MTKIVIVLQFAATFLLFCYHGCTVMNPNVMYCLTVTLTLLMLSMGKKRLHYIVALFLFGFIFNTWLASDNTLSTCDTFFSCVTCITLDYGVILSAIKLSRDLRGADI